MTDLRSVTLVLAHAVELHGSGSSSAGMIIFALGAIHGATVITGVDAWESLIPILARLENGYGVAGAGFILRRARDISVGDTEANP